MKTILAAVDFSPVTKRVFAEAAALARDAQARLILLNVTKPESLIADYAALEAMLKSAEPQGGTAGHASAIHGDSLQIIGKPVDVILEQAARCAADYIVMGSHGHTALFETVIGGTAAGVIRRAQCPVILIPAVTRQDEEWRGRGLGQKNPIAWLQRAERRITRPTPSTRKRRRRPAATA